ncbi:actin-6 [Trichonephila inaurata madagascariensis]|uniref:Actin-6 n=1 Tax=Trichonephila inaurata madagascariensis TaxID=2747483 RepID=A0A8X6Y137_9ARAC|nr:actin-6 [Trichonephila inaurata madagascariensis]GFY68873.1 actin-6 [Trichonephila inaurata madagascariensis]
MENCGVIVIDNGTGFCKAGFAGDSSPKVEFPSVVGRPRYIPVVAGLKYRNLYVGGSAQARRGILSLTYPIRQGIIQDWKDLETIWDHTFNHLLEVDPSEHAVIVSEAPKNPLRNREMMLEILFERFRCQGAFVAIQAVLALYTGGRTTGIVLDSGDGVSHAVPVYEGYAIHHAISRLEYAGRALTDYLLQLLTERGYYFTTSAEVEIVRDIKESLCFISKDFLSDMKSCAKDMSPFDRRYVLPDGQVLTVGSERFRCPEVLFRPSFLNLDGPGIHGTLFDSVMKCDVDIRKDILENVLLSGGNTLFPGIAIRLRQELQDLCHSRVRVWAPAERRYAVWLGGSILGSLSTFKDICISRSEYDDYGPKIVHRKCF